MGILIAYLLGIMSAIIPENIKRTNEESKTGDESCEPQPSGYTKRVSAEINLSPTEAKRYYSEQNKTYSLHARIFWVNIFTLLALALYTFFTYRILCATQRSANAATQSAEAAIAAQRPWLKFELRLGSPLALVPNGYSFNVIPSVNNIGNSVATNISLRLEPRISGVPDMFKLAWGYRDWCEGLKPNESGLETFFPKEGKDSPPFGVNWTDNDIKKWGTVINGKGRYVVLVYGCISYKFDGSAVLHHTGIVYELTARQDNLPYLLKPSTTYSLNELVFDHFPFDWEYAN